MKTKLEMAHEWYMMQIRRNGCALVADAWKYADAMQAEADKRNKEEAEEKRKYMRELLNADNTFLEKEGRHFDDMEWQPDWNQAPEWYNWWAMDEDRKCHWFSKKPNLVDGFDEWILGNNGEGLNNTYSPSIHLATKATGATHYANDQNSV